MKHLFKTAAFASLLMLASCFGQHNQAPSEGAHLDDPRIYGVKGGEPAQLPNKYPADESGEVADRAEQIRAKLFPKPAQAEAPVAVAAADSTAAATN
jgi:hypothetical protein